MPIIVPKPPPPVSVRLTGKRLYRDDLDGLCASALEKDDLDPIVTVNYAETSDSQAKELRLSELDLARVVRLTFPTKGKNFFVYDRVNRSVSFILEKNIYTQFAANALREWESLESVPRHTWWRRLAYVLMPVRFHPDRVQLVAVARDEHYTRGRTSIGRAWRNHRAAVTTTLITTIVGGVAVGLLLAWLL